MALLIGLSLALAVGLFGSLTRIDRERGFYPVITIVVASYYALFAAMGGDTQAIVVELGIAALFVVAAVLGFRRSLWIAVAALAAHGVQDLFHVDVVANPGVPPWWPAFCAAYDVAAAAYLAWLIRSGRIAVSGTAATGSRAA